MSKVLATVGKVAGVVATVATLMGHPEIALIASAVAPVAAVAAPIHARPPMTAISVFTDDRRAYLLADGACYHTQTGRIGQLGSKVLCLPDHAMAIGVQGCAGPVELHAAIEATIGGSSQSAMLKTLPAALQRLRYEMRLSFPQQEAAGWNQTRLWVAAYERVRARPRLFSLYSDPVEGEPDAEPFQLREIPGGWVTGLTADDVARILPAGYIRDVKEDSRRILAAQRHYPFPHLDGRCGVGGDCQLITVDRRGVRGETILRFPEAVGDLPDPTRPGEPV